MSSARLSLAIAVLGLAACAHTPSDSAFSPPDVRHAAPVVVQSADEVPQGFDDHVVVNVDRDGLNRARERAALASSRTTAYSYYYYGHTAPVSSRPATGPTQRPSSTRPAPTVATAPAARTAPRRFDSETRRSHH